MNLLVLYLFKTLRRVSKGLYERSRGFAVPNLRGVMSNQAFHLTVKELLLLGDMHSNYWAHPAFWNSWLQLLTDMLFCSFIHWKYCIKEHFVSTKSSVSTRKTYRACQYNDHHYCCLYKSMAKSRIYNFLWSSFPLMMEYTHRMMRMASGGFSSVCVSSRMHVCLPPPSLSLCLHRNVWGKCTGSDSLLSLLFGTPKLQNYFNVCLCDQTPIKLRQYTV